ncbi:hypothetical protein B0H17DRAFT_1337483 [Mycena rosella]|uniref:Uncharacterized protein n=1 Tax=Mycena rosella TaxID=1033263 RepID=A0AAD7CRF4_MYCRO|nr:hypothetical protein B0H17DRAFT_1337483 [Mycena rosella]
MTQPESNGMRADSTNENAPVRRVRTGVHGSVLFLVSLSTFGLPPPGPCAVLSTFPRVPSHDKICPPARANASHIHPAPAAEHDAPRVLPSRRCASRLLPVPCATVLAHLPIPVRRCSTSTPAPAEARHPEELRRAGPAAPSLTPLPPPVTLAFADNPRHPGRGVPRTTTRNVGNADMEGGDALGCAEDWAAGDRTMVEHATLLEYGDGTQYSPHQQNDPVHMHAALDSKTRTSWDRERVDGRRRAWPGRRAGAALMRGVRGREAAARWGRSVDAGHTGTQHEHEQHARRSPPSTDAVEDDEETPRGLGAERRDDTTPCDGPAYDDDAGLAFPAKQYEHAADGPMHMHDSPHARPPKKTRTSGIARRDGWTSARISTPRTHHRHESRRFYALHPHAARPSTPAPSSADSTRTRGLGMLRDGRRPQQTMKRRAEDWAPRGGTTVARRPRATLPLLSRAGADAPSSRARFAWRTVERTTGDRGAAADVGVCREGKAEGGRGHRCARPACAGEIRLWPSTRARPSRAAHTTSPRRARTRVDARRRRR